MTRRFRLLKTATWAIVGTLMAACVAWLITGSLTTGGIIGVTIRAANLPLYWLHEVFYDWLRERLTGDSPLPHKGTKDLNSNQEQRS